MQQDSKRRSRDGEEYYDEEVDGRFGVVDWLRVGFGVVLASQIVAKCVFGHWWSLSDVTPFGGGRHEATIKPLPAPYWGLHGYSLPHVFSLEELARFSGEKYVDGEGEKLAPIVLSINGTVFDVTSSPRFYGPWGPYRKFTGTDCSNNFQFGMFDYHHAYNTPCHWNITDFTEDQLAKVRGWYEFFTTKYPIVGTIQFPPAENAADQR